MYSKGNRKLFTADNIKSFEVTEQTTLLPFLFLSLSGMSKTEVKSLLKYKHVAIKGSAVTQFDTPLYPGDKVEVNFGRSFYKFNNPQVKVLFEDKWMVVIEKEGAIYTPEEFEMAIATTEETKNIAQKLFVFKRIYDGIQLEKQGNAAAAQIAYNQAFSVDTNYLPNYYFRGAMYMLESQNQIKAMADFNKAVELAPNSSVPYFARFVFNYVLQNYNDSLTDVNKIIEMHPDDYFIYDFRAELFEKMEKYDLAVEDCTRSIELKGDNMGILFETSELYKLRAKNYANLEQFDNAISDYSKIIELKPDNVLGYVDRAKTYIQMKEYKKAVADFDKAVEMDPKNIQFYNTRGQCYEEMGEKKKAKADFDKAKKIAKQLVKEAKKNKKI